MLQARLQQYMNQELPDVQAGFRKGRGTRDQLVANIHWIIEKAREFQKNIYFCFMTMLKHLTVWITTNCGKFLKRWEYRTTLPVSCKTYMLVRKKQKQKWNNRLVQNWERSMSRLYIVPCLFNLYAEYIMRNARLEEAQAEINARVEEAQAGIRISRRNINNLRYADDTTLMAESEEELKTS